MGWGYHGNVNVVNEAVGFDFYGYIQHPSSGNYLTRNDDNNITNNAFTGAENQIWRFQHDSTVSTIHVISSRYDEVYMGVQDVTSIAEKSNVTHADKWNTSWVIEGGLNSCRLKPYQNTNYSLDIDNNSKNLYII